jgi:hypothetical protein
MCFFIVIDIKVKISCKRCVKEVFSLIDLYVLAYIIISVETTHASLNEMLFPILILGIII